MEGYWDHGHKSIALNLPISVSLDETTNELSVTFSSLQGIEEGSTISITDGMNLVYG